MGFDEWAEDQSKKDVQNAKKKDEKLKELSKSELEEYRQEIIKGFKERYELNRKLIHFDYIPQEFQDKILSAYDNYPIKPVDLQSMVDLLAYHGVADMTAMELPNIKPLLENINNELA